ncbi:MAG: alpha/beta hydrolase [Acidobacteria bacterium]|nr:alpha/beta hydrolase [Acidobacteriota bacterium]
MSDHHANHTARTVAPASPSRRRFLRETAAALAAAPFVRPPAALGQPAVRPAPGMPAPHFVTTNGIRMAVYEQGEGVPVVFVHGFPELAYSWRNQLRSYPAAGLRAIAPDMRGYGLTDRPAEVDGYAIPSLCADLVGLLDALDIERALFCGHDWGGAAVWTMPRLYPDRVIGVIGVNTPAFGGQAPSAPAEEPLIVFTENYYATTFLEPGRAEAVFSRDVRRALEMIFRRGWYWDVENMRGYPPDSAEKTMDMLRMIEEGDYEGELIMPADVLDYWVETFEATGFTGGFNYYRANIGRGGGAPRPTGDIDVPCLYVGAENDTILRPSSSDAMPSFIPDLERHVIADCGHWTQQEQPEEFDRVTLDWIRRKLRSA